MKSLSLCRIGNHRITVLWVAKREFLAKCFEMNVEFWVVDGVFWSFHNARCTTDDEGGGLEVRGHTHLVIAKNSPEAHVHRFECFELSGF